MARDVLSQAHATGTKLFGSGLTYKNRDTQQGCKQNYRMYYISRCKCIQPIWNV